MTLSVRVIAPDKTVWDATAEEVILPSTTGQLGILTGHTPLLTALEIGVMRVRMNNDWTAIALMGGFAEVEADEVTVLVNGGEVGNAIDREAARSAFGDAQAALQKAEQGEDKQRRYQALQDFKKARAKLQASGEVVQI
ncbi:ATP synthase F1 subunit epsilon [Lyngbya confervoides]|uniref:ATP synthase epsilon chain n=1 Tax=Lyngbya confervoides BDU141951 TaxID=1574623 RepID=A0ABD4T6J9_9CYAN|nr:ATP synthase F1 subunit epsilon [Lyngbya confervoides]MCM1984187.1 ATP synthase F1 subunit epsilon [Lyngbya confervoides BDU141951]